MSLSTNAIQLVAALTNGVNAAVDTSEFGDKRTVVVNGDFKAAVTIQASADNINFVDVVSFPDSGGHADLDIAAPFMRARVSGFIRGTSILCFVTGDPTSVKTVDLALPAGGTNGTGAVADVLPLGGKKTIVVGGAVPQCAILVEAAAIVGGPWQQIACFYGPGYQVVEFEGTSMRVRISGMPQGLTFTGTVGVCAADEPETVDTNLSVKQSGEINVYLDSLLGLDSNDGLTPTTALKTLAALYEKFPLQLMNRAQVIVHLAAGGVDRDTQASYFGNTIRISGDDVANNRYHFRGPSMVLFPLTTGEFSQLNGLTITAVGRRTRIDVTPSPGWVPGELAGKFARLRVGATDVLQCFEQVITENDADSIFIDTEELTPVGVANTTLEICYPGAALGGDLISGSLWILGEGAANPAAEFYWGEVNQGAAFERLGINCFVYSSNVPGLTFDRCQMISFPSWIGGTLGHFNCSYPAGVKISCGSLEYPITGRAEDGQVDTTVGTEFATFDLILVGNPDSLGTYKAWRNVSSYNCSLATRGAITVFGMGSIFYASELALFVAPCALQGAGSLGPFIWCVYGGQARINTTAGANPQTTGTGTGSPLRVGIGAANPAIAYGTGAGAYEQAAGFNGNFHRMFAGTTAAPTGDASRIFTPVV